MPYYRKKNLLFIHIPKTGGGVIERAIKNVCKQELYSSARNKLLPPPYNQVSLQHQFCRTIRRYSEKLKVNFNNIKIFTVVRNPYDRLISDLFWYRLIKKNYTSQQVLDVIKNNYLDRNDLDNHNKPQYEFVTNREGQLIERIRIFKTGLLNKDNPKINRFLGFKINIRKKNINNDYSKYLNDKSIAIINKFYKKDFQLFKFKIRKVNFDLGLITRCKDEFFIKEFCDYYLSQGVDKIFVIDDNSNDKSIYNNINDNRVKIIYEKNIFPNTRYGSKKGQMHVVNKYYKQLKHKFKWIISVDVDEFITTKKNITNTIKDELNTTFKDVDCIKIPWVMMSCNNRDKNPNSILLENTT